MAQWQTDGNANTTPPREFFGTTDNKPLVIKTNSAVRIEVSGEKPGGPAVTVSADLTIAGNVGIGTLEPRPDAPFPLDRRSSLLQSS